MKPCQPRRKNTRKRGQSLSSHCTWLKHRGGSRKIFMSNWSEFQLILTVHSFLGSFYFCCYFTCIQKQSWRNPLSLPYLTCEVRRGDALWSHILYDAETEAKDWFGALKCVKEKPMNVQSNKSATGTRCTNAKNKNVGVWTSHSCVHVNRRNEFYWKPKQKISLNKPSNGALKLVN